MNKTILVVGGTGHQGRPVAKQLQKEGHAVRIFSRDIKRAREKMGDSFEYFQGDVRNIEDLENVGFFQLMMECSAEPSVLAGYNSSPVYIINTNLLETVN